MRAGLDRLAARDHDLARIEVQAGPLPWRVRPAGFPGLLQGIVSQQISSQAAAGDLAAPRSAAGRDRAKRSASALG